MTAWGDAALVAPREAPASRGGVANLHRLARLVSGWPASAAALRSLAAKLGDEQEGG